MDIVYRDTYGIERVGDPDVQWHPLVIHSALANTVEDISSNIESALDRGYPSFSTLFGTKNGAVAIVGSGPSLKKNWQQLKKFKGAILACNAACQFLLGKGITPSYMMCFDADPLMLEFITPHPKIVYLLASRCPPKAFDLLEGCNIVCWHAAGDERVARILYDRDMKMEPMVIGGSAAVTRAMILGISMGYTKVHLYGADSSFADGDTHIRQSTTTERRMALMCNGRVFETAPWMTQQAEDFKILAPKFSKRGIEFFVHGDGLIPHIAMSMGFKTDLEPRYKRTARVWKNRSTYLWQHL